MSIYVHAVTRGKGIAVPKITLEAILYLLPVLLMLGTNFPAFRVGGRAIYLGTNEILIGILAIGVLFKHLLGKTKLFVPKNILFLVALFSLRNEDKLTSPTINLCAYLGMLFRPRPLVNIAVALFQPATFNFWEQRIYGLFISAAKRTARKILWTFSA